MIKLVVCRTDADLIKYSGIIYVFTEMGSEDIELVENNRFALISSVCITGHIQCMCCFVHVNNRLYTLNH